MIHSLKYVWEPTDNIHQRCKDAVNVNRLVEPITEIAGMLRDCSHKSKSIIGNWLISIAIHKSHTDVAIKQRRYVNVTCKSQQVYRETFRVLCVDALPFREAFQLMSTTIIQGIYHTSAEWLTDVRLQKVSILSS